MAVSLNDIKTKIASTKNTSQITNAMQMVSAAKLGRSEEAARNFQVYAQKVRKLVTDILHGDGAGGSTNPMLISRPVKKTGYIVITSDRGLVGGYNSSILKAVMEIQQEYHPSGDDFEVICIGGMGADFFTTCFKVKSQAVVIICFIWIQVHDWKHLFYTHLTCQCIHVVVIANIELIEKLILIHFNGF